MKGYLNVVLIICAVPVVHIVINCYLYLRYTALIKIYCLFSDPLHAYDALSLVQVVLSCFFCPPVHEVSYIFNRLKFEFAQQKTLEISRIFFKLKLTTEYTCI
jgi:hypothetical protein